MNIVRPALRKFKPEPRTQALYLPENLQLADLEALVGKKDAPFAAYFIHRIIWGKVWRQDDHNGFTWLKNAYLRSIIPWRALYRITNTLLDAKVVLTDGYWIVGEKSKGYKLGPSYEGVKTVRVPCPSGKVATKLRAIKTEAFQNIRLDVHQFLLAKLQEVEIDILEARTIINAIPSGLQDIYSLRVESVANKEIEFSYCRYGRVHTNLTNLPSALRPALRYKGRQLVSIDIRNSQPLFLCPLLISARKGNKTAKFQTFKRTLNPYSFFASDEYRHALETEEEVTLVVPSP